MSSARFRIAGIVCLIVTSAALLSGCPIPIPSGYSPASRENLSNEVKEKLVKGISTREDVLLLLGEPDGVGADDSWLAYGSVYGRGGVLFVFCAVSDCGGTGGENMEYQRLIVTFDEAGIMTNSEFVSQKCWNSIFFIGNAGTESAPCMQINAPNGSPLATANDNQVNFDQGKALFIPEDLMDFANGKTELLSTGRPGFDEAGKAANIHRERSKELHDSGQWRALARVVLRDNYGDSLSWYYLGRSAEGMGLCDAAEVYYNLSKDQSESLLTPCQACEGFRLPDELENRLSAIESMRVSGKCSPPININP